MRFTWPCSSSSSMNTPLAVAAVARSPCPRTRPTTVPRLQARGSRASPRQVPAEERKRVRSTEPGLAVVGEHPLPAQVRSGSAGVSAVGSSGSGSCFASPRVPSTERGRVAARAPQQVAAARRSRRRRRRGRAPRGLAETCARRGRRRRGTALCPAPPRAPRRRPSRPTRRTRAQRRRATTTGSDCCKARGAARLAQVDVGRAYLDPRRCAPRTRLAGG